MEKLCVAIHYGADAVYLGGKSFGLRNLADNFTTGELAEAVGYAHERQVKVYLTVNAYANNADLPALMHFLAQLLIGGPQFLGALVDHAVEVFHADQPGAGLVTGVEEAADGGDQGAEV